MRPNLLRTDRLFHRKGPWTPCERNTAAHRKTTGSKVRLRAVGDSRLGSPRSARLVDASRVDPVGRAARVPLLTIGLALAVIALATTAGALVTGWHYWNEEMRSQSREQREQAAFVQRTLASWEQQWEQAAASRQQLQEMRQ